MSSKKPHGELQGKGYLRHFKSLSVGKAQQDTCSSLVPPRTRFHLLLVLRGQPTAPKLNKLLGKMALRKIRMPEVLDIKQRATQLEQTSYQLSSCLWLDLGKKSLSWAKWQALLFLSIFCPLASGTLKFHCCVTRSCFVVSQSRNLDCFVHSLPCGILKRALEIAGCHGDLNTHHQANCWRQRQDLCPRAVELMFACCDSWA